MAASSHTVFPQSTPFVLAGETRIVNNGAMNFAANLKRLRNAAGLSQEQLAHACGYPHQSRIGNYESPSPKARQPRPDELPNIAKALGVSVGDLLSDNPLHDGSAVSSRSRHTRLDDEIVSATHGALAELYRDARRIYPQDDVTRFVRLYEQLAARKAGVPEAELLGAGFTRNTGGDSERSDEVPGKGAGKKDVARRVRR
jgi:transcriptional regulator with XRE-family HTH domain